MKFSETWLREWVNPNIDSETLMHQLTMGGLEVDGHEKACPFFDGLVVAEVKSVSKHPNADKLHVCQVDCGEKELLTIVCGAANVRAGLKTVLAKVGATLGNKPRLEAIDLKGVVSYGMLCSATEIGIGESSDGIIELSNFEKIGNSLSELIDINNIIDISLTPNRGDCLSISGIAREVAVFNKTELLEREIKPVKITSEARRDIKLSAKSVCPRYAGRVIESVDASVTTPLWMSEKLRCSGIRSINIIVDITNYVMLELGQPMHAFDNDFLRGDVNVRYPDEQEKITLLDESEVILKTDTLIISHDLGPLAIAGIMGGLDSAVTNTSNTIFLESAFFIPEAIVGKSRQYGLHTDSSHRFERGVDPQLQIKAIERASQLILELCGGEAGSITEIISEKDIPQNNPVVLRKSQVKRLLGVELDDAFITDTFFKLGMRVECKEKQWSVTPPSHRFDIKIEVDLIEELARIYSYDAIDVAIPVNRLSIKQLNPLNTTVKQFREILVNNDYQEVITYSFIDSDTDNLLSDMEESLVLANPIAPELSQMRRSLMPGLLNSLKYNIKRQQDRVRLFETGLIFEGCETLQQNYHIAGLCYGGLYENQWGVENNLIDFYDLKNDVTQLLTAAVGINSVEFQVSESKMLHPGQAVTVLVDDKQVGYFGQLNPKIAAKLDLKQNVYLFDFEIKKLIKNNRVKFRPVSKFPSINRDISILVDDKIPLSEIIKNIRDNATEALSNLMLFDVYKGKELEKRKKSIALGLTFQVTSSTLTDGDVDPIIKKILDALFIKFGAKLR